MNGENNENKVLQENDPTPDDKKDINIQNIDNHPTTSGDSSQNGNTTSEESTVSENNISKTEEDIVIIETPNNDFDTQNYEESNDKIDNSENEEAEPLPTIDNSSEPIPEDTVTEELSEESEESEETEETEETNKEEAKKNSVLSFIYETLEMVAISIAIVILLITFVVRYSPVSGESMTYTINEGDKLIVQIAFYEPQKNDIVILQAPDYDLDKPLIKRVIATGGDELFIDFNNWVVKVNGETVDEYYVRYNPYIYNPSYDPPTGTMDHQTIFNIPEGAYDAEKNTFSATVPEGTIFVMGDNRNNSHDSRSANVGFVDERCVIGKAVFRLMPFSDMGTLE